MYNFRPPAIRRDAPPIPTFTGLNGVTTVSTAPATRTALAFDTNAPISPGALPSSPFTTLPPVFTSFSIPTIAAATATSSPVPSGSARASNGVIPVTLVVGICVGTFVLLASLLMLAIWLYKRSSRPKSRRPAYSQHNRKVPPRARSNPWRNLSDDKLRGRAVDQWETVYPPPRPSSRATKELDDASGMEKLTMFRQPPDSLHSAQQSLDSNKTKATTATYSNETDYGQLEPMRLSILVGLKTSVTGTPTTSSPVPSTPVPIKTVMNSPVPSTPASSTVTGTPTLRTSFNFASALPTVPVSPMRWDSSAFGRDSFIRGTDRRASRAVLPSPSHTVGATPQITQPPGLHHWESAEVMNSWDDAKLGDRSRIQSPTVAPLERLSSSSSTLTATPANTGGALPRSDVKSSTSLSYYYNARDSSEAPDRGRMSRRSTSSMSNPFFSGNDMQLTKGKMRARSRSGSRSARTRSRASSVASDNPFGDVGAGSSSAVAAAVSSGFTSMMTTSPLVPRLRLPPDVAASMMPSPPKAAEPLPMAAVSSEEKERALQSLLAALEQPTVDDPVAGSGATLTIASGLHPPRSRVSIATTDYSVLTRASVNLEEEEDLATAFTAFTAFPIPPRSPKI